MRLRTLEKLQQGEHAFIVFLGDSITEQNYHLHGKLNYVGQFTERMMELTGRKSRVLNAGSSGDTTWGSLKRLERDVLRFQPDLVFIMLGINDAQYGLEKVVEYKENLKSLVTQIREIGSEVVLLTQNLIDIKIALPPIVARVSYPYYVSALREVAMETKAPICDIHAKWCEHIADNMNTHLMYMNDTLHPNEYGHDLMAKFVFDSLNLHPQTTSVASNLI